MNWPTALALAFALTTPSIAVELPPAGGQYDSQLGGAYPPPEGTAIVSRDRAEPPAPGLYNICYVNAFQTQPSETAWWQDQHPDLLLRRADGTLVEDPNWPGEIILDTSTAAKRTALSAIVADWVTGCATAGYQAIEADNLDTYSRSDDLLTPADNLAYAATLIDIAKSQNLAFGQKNGIELLGNPNLPHFDFAIVEGCEVYDECDAYSEAYGRHVLEIEYTDTDPAFFQSACQKRGGTTSIILRDRGLQPPDSSDYTYRAC